VARSRERCHSTLGGSSARTSSEPSAAQARNAPSATDANAIGRLGRMISPPRATTPRRLRFPGRLALMADDVASYLASLREQSAQKPEDLDLHNKIGDVLLATRQHREALLAYRKVLAKQPKHPWAFPSCCYLRVVLDDEADTYREKLAAFALKNPENARARELLESLPVPDDVAAEHEPEHGHAHEHAHGHEHGPACEAEHGHAPPAPTATTPTFTPDMSPRARLMRLALHLESQGYAIEWSPARDAFEAKAEGRPTLVHR